MKPHLSPEFPTYIIISPVKDEERYVEYTLRSVISQTTKPILWLIVDDGSTDSTPDIINRYIARHTFIRLIRNRKSGERKLAFAEVKAFNWGYETLGSVAFDFIVKLDCDLSFDSEYFGDLLSKLKNNSRIGIASGIYLEMDRNEAWKEVVMPPYHAAGACKVMRMECFEEIGGFTPAPGWDTVDEIRAIYRGWTTCHFKDQKMKHHKREGSSIGTFKNSIMQGEAFRLSGGSVLFFVLKVMHRLFSSPFLVGASGLVFGYIIAVAKRKHLLVNKQEACVYNKLLWSRVKLQAKSIFQ